MSKKTVRTACAVAGMVCMTTAATVLAATTRPQAIIRRPVHVTASTATLRGVIAPNANDTSYFFSYGPTDALGQQTAERTVLYSRTAALVDTTVRGLAPGTLYDVNLRALSAGGILTTHTITFRTAGTPRMSPITGAAIVLGTNRAALTGVLSPSATPTRYAFTLTSRRGAFREIGPFSLAPGGHPVRVRSIVGRLAPGTLYSVRLQTLDASGAITHSGGFQEFTTFPRSAPTPRLAAHVDVAAGATAPYSVTTSGTLRAPRGTPRSLACVGSVTVTYAVGGRRIGRGFAPLTTSCSFGVTSALADLAPGTKVTVRARFGGNRYLRAASSRRSTVQLG